MDIKEYKRHHNLKNKKRYKLLRKKWYEKKKKELAEIRKKYANLWFTQLREQMINMYCNKCKKEFKIQDEELSNYDPKYDNDPAYRREVMDKLERSNIEF